MIIKDCLDFWLNLDYRSVKSTDIDYVLKRNPSHGSYIVDIKFDQHYYKDQSVHIVTVNGDIMFPEVILYYDLDSVLFDYGFGEVYFDKKNYTEIMNATVKDYLINNDGKFVDMNEDEVLILKTYLLLT